VPRRSALSLVLTVAMLLGPARDASAQLSVGDFLNPGDRYLVLDHATGVEWLTPVYTRNHRYDDPFVQSIMSTYGFRYATAAETQSMISTNFGDPTSVEPGDAAGYSAADAFFDVFGETDPVITCWQGQSYIPCPRTQGLTSDLGRTPGTHVAEGMLQFGNTGFAMYDNEWGDQYADYQLGSWLVRTSVTATPEPESIVLVATGLVLLAGVMRRRVRA